MQLKQFAFNSTRYSCVLSFNIRENSPIIKLKVVKSEENLTRKFHFQFKFYASYEDIKYYNL